MKPIIKDYLCAMLLVGAIFAFGFVALVEDLWFTVFVRETEEHKALRKTEEWRA